METDAFDEPQLAEHEIISPSDTAKWLVLITKTESKMQGVTEDAVTWTSSVTELEIKFCQPPLWYTLQDMSRLVEEAVMPLARHS